MDFELRFTDKEKRPEVWHGVDEADAGSDWIQCGCGANRFEQAEVTRHDPVLKKLFGFK